MKLLTLTIIIAVITAFSCQKDDNKPHLYAITNNTSVSLISNKALVLNNDSIFLQKTSLKYFFSRVDTVTSKLTTKYNCRGLTVSTLNSPPPGYTGSYQPTPDAHFTIYTATLTSDSIELVFEYSKSGSYTTYPPKFTDSLKFKSVIIKSPRLATANNQVAIGDNYNRLFQYYTRPKYCNSNNVLLNKYSFDKYNLTFYLNADTTSANFGKIIGIQMQ